MDGGGFGNNYSPYWNNLRCKYRGMVLHFIVSPSVPSIAFLDRVGGQFDCSAALQKLSCEQQQKKLLLLSCFAIKCNKIIILDQTMVVINDRTPVGYSSLTCRVKHSR